jgi:hypothetical protein
LKRRRGTEPLYTAVPKNSRNMPDSYHTHIYTQRERGSDGTASLPLLVCGCVYL